MKSTEWMLLAEVRENKTSVHEWSKNTGEDWTEGVAGLGTACTKGTGFLLEAYHLQPSRYCPVAFPYLVDAVIHPCGSLEASEYVCKSKSAPFGFIWDAGILFAWMWTQCIVSPIQFKMTDFLFQVSFDLYSVLLSTFKLFSKKFIDCDS